MTLSNNPTSFHKKITSRNNFKLFAVIVMCLYSYIIFGQDCDDNVREEVAGVVIIEVESTTSDLGEWFEDTDVDDFTGDGYLEFNGNRPQNGDPNSPLVYQFRINEAGLYFLHLRCARETLILNGVERDDVANDCFVRVEGDYEPGPNVGDNHGDDASLEVLMTDTKFFGGADFEFVWASGNRLDLGGDTNKRRAAYNFKEGEIYTLVVSGRSQFFKLDRIMFRRESVNSGTAQNTDITETIVNCALSVDDVTNSALDVVVFPNPTSDFLTLDSSLQIKNVEFFTLKGEKVKETTSSRIDMSEMSVGLYLINVYLDNGKMITKKILKE